MAADPALAQDHATTSGRQRAVNRSEPILFRADEVNDDQDYGLIVARGNVELDQTGRTLLADTVTYNERSDTVTASGHVSLIETTGEVASAEFMELHDAMREGFIKDVKVLLADRSRLVGNTARRTDGSRTELRRGVYSPCDLCAPDPTEPPAWQLKAERIVHDSDRKIVEYDDVTMEIDGIPVLYSPYLSHPDPTVKRQDGFLPGSYGSSTSLGVHTSISYYWVTGPSSDFTFSPIFSTNQGVDLVGAFRERFSDGEISVEASVTRADRGTGTPDSTTVAAGQIRGHIFVDGIFDLDDNFRAAFSIKRVTDDTYLQVYELPNPGNFLQTHAYAEDFQGRDYGSVDMWAFQSQLNGVSDRSQALVLPVANYTWADKPFSWGGRLTTTVDALDILRETGSSDRRVSAGTEFDLPFTALGGQRFNLVAGVRGDAYYANAVQLVPNGPLTTDTTFRPFPQVGLEWRYPWVGAIESDRVLIEPRAAAYAAPVGLNPVTIPNDDGGSEDFNDTELFTRNRFAGFDQVDSGQRVDYGLHAAWYGSAGGEAQFLFGQSYRFQQQSPFTVNGLGDGLQTQASDYVGRVSVSPAPYLDLLYRYRLDHADMRPQRQEAIVEVGPQRLRLDLSYIQLGQNAFDAVSSHQQAAATLNLGITPYWTLTLHDTRAFAASAQPLPTLTPAQQIYTDFTANAGGSVRYEDECLMATAALGESGIRNRDLHPGISFLFTVAFKNLGDAPL
jgi:LPS-assembly protein